MWFTSTILRHTMLDFVGCPLMMMNNLGEGRDSGNLLATSSIVSMVLLWRNGRKNTDPLHAFRCIRHLVFQLSLHVRLLPATLQYIILSITLQLQGTNTHCEENRKLYNSILDTVRYCILVCNRSSLCIVLSVGIVPLNFVWQNFLPFSVLQTFSQVC